MKRIFLLSLLFLFLGVSTASALLQGYPKFQAIDSNGDPLSGGLLYTYAPGTSTPKAAYTDKDCATPADNPVVLDSSGEANVYICAEYKFVLKTSAGTTLWTIDDINEATTVSLADNTAEAWALKEGSNTYITIATTDGAELITFAQNVTFAGITIPDLGTVTTADINGGTVDGVVIGGANPQDGTFDVVSVTESLLTHQGADVASGSALDVTGAGNFFDVTGTTTVTSIASKGVGSFVVLEFDGVLTLTHHATDLILPGAANITTAAGDVGMFYEYASGDWRCVSWEPADGAGVATASGGVVQIVNTQDGAVSTGTTTLPADDTIPQNTEGDEYMTLAVTPTSASNKLKIDVVFNYSHNNYNDVTTVALFQDSTAAAIAAAGSEHAATINLPGQVIFTYWMTAGTTSSTTFKVRAGTTGGSATLTFNGSNASRRYGGVGYSSITITEIAN